MKKIIKNKKYSEGHTQYRRRKSSGSGFVILFAVTISAILLSIALGVTNIAFREIKFGTSAKDSNDAFFAADAGIECAMVYDRLDPDYFDEPSNDPKNAFTGAAVMNCAGSVITIIQNPPSFWSFTISGLGNGGQGCAKVTVDKTDLNPIFTSKGYNNGGYTCISGPNTVERQIELGIEI
jgi:hypothetical protein